MSVRIVRTILHPPPEESSKPSRVSKADLFVRIANAVRLTLLIIFGKSFIVLV